MRRLSITARVALLCTLITAAIAALAIMALAIGEQRMLREYYMETLASAAQLAHDDVVWDGGRIEIDRNLDEMPNVIAAVYTADGDLVYGRTEFDAPFIEGARRIGDGDDEWYVHDMPVESETGRRVWLRLYMSSGAAGSLSGVWQKLMLVIFPVLTALAGIGGWAVARRAFRPVARIAVTAAGIADGEDLKKRIGLEGAHDELYRLAQIFDGMLERLDSAFERERRFTSDVSHELRTPVAAILAQSEFALSDAADDTDRREALREIYRRAGGMRELTRKLLTLSRMEARQLIPQFEVTDIALIADMASECFRDAAEERRVAIEVDASGPVEVRGDQTMLTQAVMNLVENAVRYGREGGYVKVRAEDLGDSARVSVADDGCGMTPEQAQRIFDRFYQADPSRHGEGAGLGLSLALRIARLHSGRIDVESEPGKGSRFTLTLPKGD